jgi:hypothetical protein
LLIYGLVTFSESKEKEGKPALINVLTSKGWNQFTSGFIVGGFGGASIAYILLKFISFDMTPF